MSLFGTSLPVFLGLTVGVFGGAAWLTGQALAANWRRAWQLLPHCLALAAASRFFDWALFDGNIRSPVGFLLGLLVVVAAGGLAYRATQARQMVRQYPWLYERAGPFGWRARRE